MSLVDDVTDAITKEIEMDSSRLATALNPSLPGEAYTKQTQAQYLDYFKRNWSDPVWRHNELDRVGSENFMNAAYDAFNLANQKPSWSKYVPPATQQPPPPIGPQSSGQIVTEPPNIANTAQDNTTSTGAGD